MEHQNLYKLAFCIQNQLTPMGATSIQIDYEGSGDSGQGDTITLLSPDGVLEFPEFVAQAEDAEQIEPLSFEDFLTSVADDLIEFFGHSGYENNEGGQGKFVIAFVDGGVHVTNEHIDNYTQKEDETVEFSAEEAGEEKATFESLFSSMNQVGLEEIEVSYSGSGDSGDIMDATASPEKELLLETSGMAMVMNHALGCLVPIQETIGKLAKLAADIALESKLGGWEINSGSSGTVNIKASGEVTIAHTNYLEDSITDTSEHEFKFDDLAADDESDDGDAS